MMSFFDSIKYGNSKIDFEIVFSNRKTLEIGVNPEMRVIVRAPVNTKSEDIRFWVRKRAGWIKNKKRFFLNYQSNVPERQFVGGESHLYLGRHYRLKISSGNYNSIKLLRGYFEIICKGEKNPDKIKKILDEWYIQKAKQIFSDRLDYLFPFFEKMGFQKPCLRIRKMKTRWGSLSSKGNMTINLYLIKAPKESIDYLIVHELCHLKYKRHDRKYYAFLDKIMPDWRARKKKLEISL